MFPEEKVLTAIRTYLQDELTNVRNPKNAIRVMPDEIVPPGAPEEFISIIGGEAVNLNPPHVPAKDFLYSFSIGITRRMEGIPNEDAGETILSYNEDKVQRVMPSMLARADEIAILLEDENGWTLLTAINALIGAANGGFLVPFGLSTINPRPEKVGEEHFDAEAGSAGHSPVRYIGLYLPLEFAGAEFLKVT